MDAVAVLSQQKRNELFKEVAEKRGWGKSVIIEKDFWVCLTLEKLFSLVSIRPHLIFKGGTSLSKVFNVIDRFSEDIDLSISRECFGFSEAKYLSQDMGTKEIQRRKKVLGDKCDEYVSKTILSALRHSFKELLGDNDRWSIILDSEDPSTLLFNYPYDQKSSGDYSYIKPTVRMEFGARSDHWPSSTHDIKPYAAEEFPNYFKQATCSVKTLAVERTFWEKTMVLHAEAHRADAKSASPRYSRHYYDVALMIKNGVGNRALSDLKLLDAVRQHELLFWTAKWASYETAKPGTLRLMPLESRHSELKRDYELLKEMMFANIPRFEEIMSILRLFENKINT